MASRENRRLTEFLCQACNLIQDIDGVGQMGGDLYKWWKKHRAEDEDRRKKEQEKKALKEIASKAIGKLTSEEIEALRVQHGLVLKK